MAQEKLDSIAKILSRNTKVTISEQEMAEKDAAFLYVKGEISLRTYKRIAPPPPYSHFFERMAQSAKENLNLGRG